MLPRRGPCQRVCFKYYHLSPQLQRVWYHYLAGLCLHVYAFICQNTSAGQFIIDHYQYNLPPPTPTQPQPHPLCVLPSKEGEMADMLFWDVVTVVLNL